MIGDIVVWPNPVPVDRVQRLLVHQSGDLQSLADTIAHQPEVVHFLLGASVRMDPPRPYVEIAGADGRDHVSRRHLGHRRRLVPVRALGHVG